MAELHAGALVEDDMERLASLVAEVGRSCAGDVAVGVVGHLVAHGLVSRFGSAKAQERLLSGATVLDTELAAAGAGTGSHVVVQAGPERSWVVGDGTGAPDWCRLDVTVEQARDEARLLWAWCAAGAAERYLRVAHDYSKERMAFGVPLHRHQAVRTRLAELRTAVAGSRCLNVAAMEPDGDRPWRVWAAADTAAAVVVRVAEQCFALHGARGYQAAHVASTFPVEAHVFAERIRRLRPGAAPVPVPSGGKRPFQVAVRSAMEGPTASASVRAAVRGLAEAGCLGVGFAEDEGGAGGDLWDCVALHEELARRRSSTLSTAVLSHLEVGARLVAECATPPAKDRWLRAALRGEVVLGYAATEAEAGSDLAATTTSARRDGDGWVLDGSKRFITNACEADALCVLVRTGEHAVTSHTLFVVPMAALGVAVARLDTVGNRETLGEVRFDGVRIDDDARLGATGQGLMIQIRRLAHERAFVAVVLAALAAAALIDVEGSERAARLAVRVEEARRLAYEAVATIVAGRDARAPGAMAKLVAARCLRAVTSEALAVSGPGNVALRQQYLDALGFAFAGGTETMLLEAVAR